MGASAFEPAAASSHYLHPGQLLVSAVPTIVSTVLGSCVAVCLYDEPRAIGGLNHFVLPEAPNSQETSIRFAAAACDELLGRLEALGARRERLHAKVFGGAWVLGGNPAEVPLGTRNLEVALRWLRTRAIPIVVEHVGGTYGRKLVFDTGTGTAWVRTLGDKR